MTNEPDGQEPYPISPKEALMREIIAHGDDLMDEMAAYAEFLKHRNRIIGAITIGIIIITIAWIASIFIWFI